MAKYRCDLQGDFGKLLNTFHSGILNGNASASFEDGSGYLYNDIRCVVHAYERYSMIGGNRISLNITLTDNGNRLFLTAIISGGSQAVFFKVDAVGEESFLDCVKEIVENYSR